MELTIFKKKTEPVKKKKTKKKKKRFSLKRSLVSWSVTTILVMTSVALIKRSFGKLIPGDFKGMFKKNGKK